MNIKILAFFSFLFLFIFSSGILYCQENTKVQVFDDPKHRYKLTLPDGWEVYTENGESIFTSVKGENNFASCYVYGFPVESGMTIDEIASWVLEGFNQESEGHSIKNTARKGTTVAGVDGLFIRMEEKYKEGEQEKVLVLDEYFFIKGNQCIILHFDTTKEAYNNFKGDFDKIVSSFSPGEKSFDDIITSGKTGSGTKPSPSPKK
jgi:hypothetical protein